MHLIAAVPGGWNPNDDEIFHIEQTPGDVIFLSAADTEIHTLHNAYKSLVSQQTAQKIPSLRMCNLVYLKKELTIDTYIEEILEGATVVVARLLGGANYYPYLVESLEIWQRQKTHRTLILLPAHEPDVSLLMRSSVAVEIAHKCNAYLQEGGKKNYRSFLNYLFHLFFKTPVKYEPLTAIPDIFLYEKKHGIVSENYFSSGDATLPFVVVLAYKTHYAADNLNTLHTLSDALKNERYRVGILFVSNLRDKTQRTEVARIFQMLPKPSGIITTNGFAIKSADEKLIFETVGVPVIQAIFCSITQENWQEGAFGLPPTDIAMNVVLPEVDGRIITRAIGFKEQLEKDPLTDSMLVKYTPYLPACRFVAQHLKGWQRLQGKKNTAKKIAVILPNYPNKDSRLANGVGLDTPESAVVLLNALQKKGYDLGGVRLPKNGTQLMHWLTQVITNDTEKNTQRPHTIFYPINDFNVRFQTVSVPLKNNIKNQWGDVTSDPYFRDDGFVISGFLLGNIFISIQPSRGYNQDPQAVYHSPDLPPTYYYLAYYFWLEENYQADAVIHLGKHGNLEWLPGKSIALDETTCFPAAVFGALPHFYPFIINDPGEGTQAKRRNQAVIIDHLIPPMTRAEQHGVLLKLEHLVEEYYQAIGVDKKRMNLLETKIKTLVAQTHLQKDLSLDGDDLDTLLLKLDGYLCELKEAQIRDGLHIFGCPPQDDLQADLLLALHRNPSDEKYAIPKAILKDLNIDDKILQQPYETVFQQKINGVFCRTVGKAIAQIEKISKELLTQFLAKKNIGSHWKNTRLIFEWIVANTVKNIAQTTDEMTNLLKGLSGEYVPSGAAGAPTRGRLDLLPTGRNFYSVDVRTVPTETAYELGVKSADRLIERHLQEEGDYPKTVGISVWGTATMRTGGDDIAQAFALMGVCPIWKNINRTVRDFEVIPLLKLGRPRVDVVLRVSGFFRDAFPDIINLFNAVVEKIAHLDEPLEKNPIRARFLQETTDWQKKGLPQSIAKERSLYRVFGSKPGAYGAGLQAVIDEKNWKNTSDLAEVYMQWSAYAYTHSKYGVSARDAFETRLKTMDVVLQNQDNREHDLLDSDDYYQFHGGLANAVENVKGTKPAIYFGDHSNVQNPKIKTLKEELLKVYRSRVVNPKWMAGVQRHGYKGAFEMNATLDYLFAYDATTDLIDDFMYEGITDAYLKDPENKAFLERHNPWAIKDMSERLLEAMQRGLWKNPEKETEKFLKALYIETEGLLE